MNEKAIEITGKLAENEETLGKLYHFYANKFPDYHQFWQDLVTAEARHANWIRQLQSEAEKERLLIKPYRFNATAVQNHIKHVEEEMKKAAQPGYTIINALSAALNFETGLIESKYFEVVESYPPEMKKIFIDIYEDTQSHVTKVREAWQKIKSN